MLYTRLQPILFVGDLSAEVEFYQKLGFQVAFQFEGFAGITGGDNILFGLEQHSQAQPLEKQPLTWQIGTRDIDGILRLCQKEGLTVLQPPALQPWEEWVMVVQSPNGYQVHFEGEKQAS